MKILHNIVFGIISSILLAIPITAQQPVVKTGLEVLACRNFDILKGKRVGLITNPTGVDSQLRSTIDLLFEAQDVKLVALFGPEHGVRGDAHAGDKIATLKDKKTGIPIYSLYGNTRKPTRDMLRGIDIIVYDIQDIGCRSYTYISTLGLAMEAAGEAGIPFVVLDRPNPLGGLRIEGNITEPYFISFVSQYSIPYVYGLTCGELASFINGEHLNKVPCQLTIIPMEGWERWMIYEDTGLPWVAPSPHIPHASSALYYPLSGIIGELNVVSIGVGYTLPFQTFATEWADAEALSTALNAKNIPGIVFRPIHYKPYYGIGKGKILHGVEVYFTDPHIAPLSPIQYMVVEELYKQNPTHSPFMGVPRSKLAMFDKVCGSNEIRIRFGKNHKWADVKAYWNKDVDAFRERITPYLLYQ